MATFLVKRELPGITPAQLTGAGVRVKTCAAELQSEGSDVRWVRSFFLPATEETHCYFEAHDAATVKRLNELAQIPFLEISEVQEMTPDAL